MHGENRFPKFVKAFDVKRSPFIVGGFVNWKRGREMVERHESSIAHREAETLFLAHNNQESLEVAILRKSDAEKKSNREALECIFDAMTHLARQGQAFRGHIDAESNFKQLLALLSKHNITINEWMARAAYCSQTYTWTSPKIQNEILEMLHHAVQRHVLEKVRENRFFALIVDETTDLSVHEQVSLCVRHVSKSFEIRDDFLGFDQTDRTDAEHSGTNI